MSNRQARREQSRASRQQTPQRPPQRGGRPPAGRPGPPPKRRTELPDFLSPGFLAASAAVLLVLIGAIAWMLFGGGGGGRSSGQQLADKLRAGSAALASVPPEYVNGLSLGAKDAPLVMDMYEDFQCEFCLRYSAEDEPTLIEEYVKTGKVRMVFRNLPILGRESVDAAKSGYCAGQQNKFWPFASRLFAVQAEAGQFERERLDVGRFTQANLRGHAQAVGLDMAKYDACLGSPEAATAIADDNRAASHLGLRSTPSFIFNGRPLQGGGAPSSLDSWRALLDGQIAAALATPTPAGSATASPSPSGTTTATTTPTTSPPATAATGTATPAP